MSRIVLYKAAWRMVSKVQSFCPEFANFARRHLDEFQKIEIAIKLDKLYRKMARCQFDSEAAMEAGIKSGSTRQPHGSDDHL